MKKIIVLLSFLLFIAFPIKANLDSLLTGIDTIKEVTLTESPRNFENNDLFTMIDGGAEIYIEYGFKKALDVAYLMDSSNRIGIQIYEMTDDAAAFGIFSSSRNTGDSSLQIGDYTSGNEYYLMVQKSRFFYIVSSVENTAKGYKIITEIASTISSNIKDERDLPELVKKSQLAGYKIEQVKYIRGKIALSGSYFFSHKDIFNSNNAICINNEVSKTFIFEYSDSLAALRQFKTITQEMISSGRFSDFKTENTKFACLDRNSKPVEIRVHKKYIVIIAGADNADMLFQNICNVY